ncbi:MAG: hypothetical protein U9R53_06395, partial [Chloroflexota bacterium]|nr:hypothetical protein [Chloroflexota bacterium]
MNKKFYVLLVFLALAMNACGQAVAEEPVVMDGEAFELYFIADPELSGSDLKNYDLEDLPLTEEPFLSTDDIVSYMWETHAINLTEEAYLKVVVVFSQGIPISGAPFVVVSNGERIYAGAFWSLASSASFDGVVIQQPFDPAGQPLFISLGYPSPDFFTGEDPR